MVFGALLKEFIAGGFLNEYFAGEAIGRIGKTALEKLESDEGEYQLLSALDKALVETCKQHGINEMSEISETTISVQQAVRESGSVSGLSGILKKVMGQRFTEEMGLEWVDNFYKEVSKGENVRLRSDLKMQKSLEKYRQRKVEWDADMILIH